MKIELTKKQVSDILTLLFVGTFSFQDEKNKELAKTLHAELTQQFFKDKGGLTNGEF